MTPDESAGVESGAVDDAGSQRGVFPGRHFLSQSSSDGERAVDAFRRAIAADANHAGARAGLARGILTWDFWARPRTRKRGRWRSPRQTARSTLDPDSGEAHAVMADLRFYYDWDWAGADTEYRRAIALNTSFARARSQFARFLAAARPRRRLDRRGHQRRRTGADVGERGIDDAR